MWIQSGNSRQSEKNAYLIFQFSLLLPYSGIRIVHVVAISDAVGGRVEQVFLHLLLILIHSDIILNEAANIIVHSRHTAVAVAS